MAAMPVIEPRLTTQPAPSAPVALPEQETEEALDRLYHLVLLDDDHHTYAYVIEMLGDIFGYSREKAFALARMVDGEGRVILETASLERVTQHQQQVHSYGPDHRLPQSVGSMSAIIEEADAPS